MSTPAEDVLTVVAEFGADLQAAAKNAIDAIRETAATSQESYALAPLPPGTWVRPSDGSNVMDTDLTSLSLGSVIRAKGYDGYKHTYVAARPGRAPWYSPEIGWAPTTTLTDVEVLHLGLCPTVPS